MALQVKFKDKKATPAAQAPTAPAQRAVAPPAAVAPATPAKKVYEGPQMDLSAPVQGGAGSDRLQGGGSGAGGGLGGGMSGLGNFARSNPELISAMMQFGINLSAGMPFAQAIGGAGAAAGRVANMRAQESERLARSGYAAEDQAMQRGRYNMDVANQEAQAEYRKQQQQNADRRYQLDVQQEERLAKGGSNDVSATTQYKEQRDWLEKKQKQITEWATDGITGDVDMNKLNDPAWVQAAEEQFSKLLPPPQGAGAQQAPTQGAKPAAAASSKPSPEQVRKEATAALARAKNNIPLQEAIKKRALEMGVQL